jgi:hypothetical protein
VLCNDVLRLDRSQMLGHPYHANRNFNDQVQERVSDFVKFCNRLSLIKVTLKDEIKDKEL